MGFLDKFKSKISANTSTTHSIPSTANTTKTEEGTKYVPKTYRAQNTDRSADKEAPTTITTNNTVPGEHGVGAQNGVEYGTAEPGRV